MAYRPEAGDRVRVSVSLCAILRDRGLGREGEVELIDGATPADLLRDMGLSDGGDLVVCVNGRPAGIDSPLADGDSLYVFLPVSGG